MTGLQLLQTVLYGDPPRVSTSETIPMTMDVTEADTAHFGAQAGKCHLNPLGGVHGNPVATVLNSVTGCAVHLMLEAGVGYGTVDLNMKVIRTVPVDMPLMAAGRMLHLSRTISVSGDTLKTQDDTLLTHATVTYVIRHP